MKKKRVMYLSIHCFGLIDDAGNEWGHHCGCVSGIFVTCKLDNAKYLVSCRDYLICAMVYLSKPVFTSNFDGDVMVGFFPKLNF